MKYRIITFAVTADGDKVSGGIIGTIGKYNPNTIKTGLAQQHKANHPHTKIAVLFTEVKEVTEEEYNAAAERFVKI